MALKGAPDGSQFNLDTLFPIAESLASTIFQQVALSYVGDPQAESLLRRTSTVAMVSGVGTLPDEALTSCKFGASIGSSTDVTIAQTQALVPFWSDFVQPRNGIQSQLNWWYVSDNTSNNVLKYLAPQEEYPGTFTGNLEYTGAHVPAIPATASATLDVVGEVLSDLQDALSKALMGEMQKAV